MATPNFESDSPRPSQSSAMQETAIETAIDTVRLKEFIKKWETKGEKITILLTGKSGAGKSSLVNGILGVEELVAEEGDWTSHRDGGVTRTVISYPVKKCGIPFTVIDSPGLQDLDYEELSDGKILEDIKMKLRDNLGTQLPDLVIYCVPMNIHRLDVSDVLAMKHLTQQLTPDLWKRTIFVLTFANCVRIPSRYRGSDASIEEYFETHLTGFRSAIKNALVKAGCNEEITENIKVVPAGYYIPNKQDLYPDDPWKLPKIEDWFSNIWEECNNILSEEKQVAMFISQANRIKVKVSDSMMQEEYVVVEKEGQDSSYQFFSKLPSVSLPSKRTIYAKLEWLQKMRDYIGEVISIIDN